MFVPAQIILTGSLLLSAFWFHWPWLAFAGLGLVGTGAIAMRMAAAARPAIWQCGLAMALTGSILLLATLVAKGVILDTYYSLAALAVAAIIFLAGKADLPRWLISVWKALGMLWLFIGAFVLLAIGYDQNNVLLFYGALTFGLLLLFASKRLFELSLIGTNIIN